MAWVVVVLFMGGIALVVPRFAPRSPLAIVALCVGAILTMKLVEHRIRQWFDRWAKREAARTTPPDRRV